MILNLYIETSTELALYNLLITEGYDFYDATAYDSYAGGPCKLETLEEIKEDIER
jgi:hypothetical protein